MLTKRHRVDIIVKLSQERRRNEKSLEKRLKKIPKKALTKASESDIINLTELER